MKNLIIVLILFGAINFSCSNNISSNETERISLPLKIGNSWTYNLERTTYRDSTIIKVQEGDVEVTVKCDTVVDGVQWFFIDSDNGSYNSARAGYYSNQDDGIYFTSTFESVESENTKGKDFVNGNVLLNTESVSNNELNKHLFLHNPDSEIPDRLIKNNQDISSISYKGETESEDFNTSSQNYIWNYYQLKSSTRTYTINPFDVHFSVSNDFGLIIFEIAYVSTGTRTENDPRLKLTTLLRFELKEFNEN